MKNAENGAEMPPLQSISKPSKADEIRLKILEELKTRWDLVPKQSTNPMMIQAGVIMYENRAGEDTIPHPRWSQWMHGLDIDFYQLQSILSTFKNEGLISDFDFVSEFR
jgi:hypothetical protein